MSFLIGFILGALCAFLGILIFASCLEEPIDRETEMEYRQSATHGSFNMRFSILAIFALILASSQANAQALRSFNDCSIASMSGSSQSLLSSNPQRSYILVCNTGATNDNIGVNFAGGTAAIAGAGTMTLVPGSCKEFAGLSSYLPNPPAGNVTVIGTSGQPVACYEGR